jgi:arylformamidase
LSKRSAYVKFTDEVEEKLSPIRHLEAINAPIAVLFGSLETPEFQRQSREFADALTRAGKPCEQTYAEHYNHFEIQESLGNPYAPVGRAVLAMMKLKA